VADETPTEPIPEFGAPARGDGQQRFPCGQCGAKLVYKPGTANLKCQYCGYENAIPQSEAQIDELGFEAYLTKLAATEETGEHTTFKCDACAAEIDKPPGKDAFACPFCGSDIVATAKSHKLIKPKSLLAFRIEQAEVRARFRNWVRKLWFAPNALKKFNRMERLAGIYIPYWTYDCNTTSAYTGQRGEHYYVTVGSGKNRRRERRTRWYSASGVVFNSFNDVLVLASESLPRKLADNLEPWGLRDLVPYEDAYLSGFQAESYQIDLVGGFVHAKEIMAGHIRDTVRGDIGGDEQRIDSVSTRYDHLTFKHILLPIWISAYRYRGKTYRYLVNGRTGEVQGERPYSWIKITLAVLGGAVVAAGVVWGLIKSGVIDL
jgi:DNA-directed RNA polymerase subunit RPC12/RpoP